MNLYETIGNQQWLNDNLTNIKAVLPQEWIFPLEMDLDKLTEDLKNLGINIENETNFSQVMTFFEFTNILKRNSVDYSVVVNNELLTIEDNIVEILENIIKNSPTEEEVKLQTQQLGELISLLGKQINN